MDFKKWLDAPNRAKINPKNIKSFFVGTVRGFISRKKPDLIPDYIKEQVYVRAVLAEPCILNGTCISCGCTMKDKIWSDSACDKYYRNEPYCYAPFKTKEQWDEIIISKDTIEKGKQILKDAK